MDYHIFEGYCGDQPFMNLALYNEHNINIIPLKRGDGLDFSKSHEQTMLHIEKTLIHFNSGVGNESKLYLMQEAFNTIEIFIKRNILY